ncbi:MAG: SgcJ/EcaC family oxidoreductase [Chlamydiia bacterium]|nr:SgcJ/EcaC family oxidoreductase [Chlamydiia bacterium]
MTKYVRYFVFTFFCFTAADVFALDDEDIMSINQVVAGYVDAWNNYHGEGFSKDFTDDAEFINIFGMVFSGKESIEKRHILIHQTILKDSIFEVLEMNIREAAPGVAVALVHWRVDGFQKPGNNNVKETIYGVFSHTFIKNQGKWEIAHTQNTLKRS